MAKGRRPARAKRKPNAAPKPPASGAGPEAAGASGDELADRLANLRAEVSDARTEAVSRAREASSEPEGQAAAPAPEPGVAEHGRRNRAAVLVATLAAVGVLIGLIVAGLSGSKGSPAPVASYLQANVPEGTPVGVVPGSASAVPKGYPVVAVASASSLKNLKYAVGPDPIAQAGPLLSTWFGGHGTVVANNPGKASLYMVVAAGTAVAPTKLPASPPPATTVAPTSVAPSTAPATTAPATTTPPTTLPPTTLPPTTPPPTTPPTTTPPTTTPPVPTGPASPPSVAAPPPNASGGPAGQVTAVLGDSFWSIATQTVQQRLGHPPTTAQVAHYWAQLIATNSGRLVQAGNPNLIYPGQTFVLPAG